MLRRALPFLLLAFPLSIAAQLPPQQEKAIRELVAAERASRDIPAVSIAIARNGMIVFEDGFGLADREAARVADAQTIFRIASVTKPLTATALMLLVDDERIAIERPLNDYLAADEQLRIHVGTNADVTVRRVASHTSGLAPHDNYFYEDMLERPPVLGESLRRYGNVTATPGREFVYSNIGYAALGAAIEHVSGMPLDRFLRERVFTPLGMTRSSIGPGPASDSNRAANYSREGKRLPRVSADTAAASLGESTVHDLALFGIAHLRGDVLTNESRELMQSADAVAQRYGIGWYVGKRAGGEKFLAHSGGMEGTSSMLLLIPEHQLVVALLANKLADTTPIVQKVTQLLLGEPDGPSPFNPPTTPPERAPLAAEWKQQWRGTIRTSTGDVAIELDLRNETDARVRVGSTQTLVNDLAFIDGVLRGRIPALLETPDALRWAHSLRMSLTMRDGRLEGSVRTSSNGHGRIGPALAHFAVLSRVTP